MADGRHLEKKSKNCHISVIVWRISTKFGIATQFDPLEPSDRYKIQILKTQYGGGHHPETSQKSPYLGHSFNDFDQIWHGDAVRPPEPCNR